MKTHQTHKFCSPLKEADTSKCSGVFQILAAYKVGCKLDERLCGGILKNLTGTSELGGI